MAHPIEQKIGQVRSRARRLLVLYAAGCTAAVVVSLLVVLGLADYLIRFQDHGIRLMASLALLAAGGWCLYRYWVGGVFRSSLGDLQLAQRIERRYPSLTDRLSSAIEFLKQGETDAGAGSAALRRAVVVDTGSRVDELDLTQVFDARPTRWALALGGGALAIAALLAALAPDSARLALVRLANPLGDDAWPRYYHLEFRARPTRLAAGQNFEVELLRDNAHRLPGEVQIHYRYETGEGNFDEEIETMRWVNGALLARKDAVARPFFYRAVGGDDHSMAWTRLEVLEAPRVEGAELTLHPPAYTGLPTESSERSIHAVAGTRVELTATATKKLRKAVIRLEPEGEVPLTVSADGHTLSLAADAAQPWVVQKSGQYWIELEDSEGLTGGTDEKFEIRAVADMEPTVTIEQPGTNIFVTAAGEVPLQIAVKDDLAIHDIVMHYSRSDRTDVEDFSVSLHTGPSEAPRQDEPGRFNGGQLGESRVVNHRWSLAELELKPATQVTFWATASDYLPQTGKSTVRKLTIITPAELDERLAQRQMLVLAELQRVLKMQQDARGQTRSLEIQTQQVGRIGKPELDHAQAAELNQRQVARTLTSPSEGIPAQVADFLEELHSNKVDNPDLERRMTAILEESQRLGEQHLQPIERELTGFIKAAQSKLSGSAEPMPPQSSSTVPTDKELDSALASAGQNQDQVVSSLERMLGDLGRWDNYRRFAREINQLQRDQEEITHQTKELQTKTLGRNLKDLEAQQQADLKKLASQQIDLSRKLEKTQQQMAEAGENLAQQDPIAAAAIEDGLHQARQQAISGQMRSSSEQLEKNQLGQAAQQQAKIAKDLDDLLGILSNRREQELERLVKQLREAETELARLREQQAGLRKKMKAAEEIQDPAQRKKQLERLAREQKQLQEQSARLARKLERLQAEQAGKSANSAAGQMSKAGEAGEQGDNPAAQDQAERAERDLEEAQQQLAERRKQAEEDLAREQVARMEDALKSLHGRQNKLIEETQRLENLRAAEGRLTRAQLGTVNDLSRLQRALRGETLQLAEKLALTEVIHLALDGAAGQMNKAADALAQRETGSTAQTAQELARQRLAQLLTALDTKNDKRKPGQQGEQGGGSGSGGGQQRSDGNYVLAQLKLLRLLQDDLNARYRGLVAGGQDQPDAERQMTELAQEQGKLAELTLKLSEPADKKPEDDPEKLPDVRQTEPNLDDELLKGLNPDAVPGADAEAQPAPAEVPPPDTAPESSP